MKYTTKKILIKAIALDKNLETKLTNKEDFALNAERCVNRVCCAYKQVFFVMTASVATNDKNAENAFISAALLEFKRNYQQSFEVELFLDNARIDHKNIGAGNE